MSAPTSLSTLPAELLFRIFKLLDRPGKMSLALTCPHMLHHFAKYYDLDRYRSNPYFARKIGVLDSVSWDDSKAQGAIIRWIALPGHDDIDDPGDDIPEEEEGLDQNQNFGGGLGNELDLDDERFKPYDETKAGKEEAAVQQIIEHWLREKCGIEGGVILCAECYKFMRLRRDDGKKPWCTKMLEQPLWFRHCGPCRDSYGIARDSVLT